MKHKLLKLACLLLISTAMTPNARAQSKAEIGLHAGVNLANLIDENFDANSHTGFMAGIYARIPVSGQKMSLQPEVLYSQKGFDDGDTSYRIDYVDVPLLARVDFSSGANLTPFIYFGPYIGFKVNTEVPPTVVYANYQLNSVVPCFDTCYPRYPQPGRRGFQKGDINPTDLGFTVGGGLDLGFIDLVVRYDAGLTDVSDDDGVSAQNGVLSVVTGIRF